MLLSAFIILYHPYVSAGFICPVQNKGNRIARIFRGDRGFQLLFRRQDQIHGLLFRRREAHQVFLFFQFSVDCQNLADLQVPVCLRFFLRFGFFFLRGFLRYRLFRFSGFFRRGPRVFFLLLPLIRISGFRIRRFRIRRSGFRYSGFCRFRISGLLPGCRLQVCRRGGNRIGHHGKRHACHQHAENAQPCDISVRLPPHHPASPSVNDGSVNLAAYVYLNFSIPQNGYKLP